jgi:hypothetical protein
MEGLGGETWGSGKPPGGPRVGARSSLIDVSLFDVNRRRIPLQRVNWTTIGFKKSNKGRN